MDENERKAQQDIGTLQPSEMTVKEHRWHTKTKLYFIAAGTVLICSGMILPIIKPPIWVYFVVFILGFGILIFSGIDDD